MAILTDSPSSQWTSLGPPEEITGGLVGQGREFVRAHPLVADTLLAAVLLEAGAVMATLRWEPAGDTLRSLLFLSACVVAALFTGLAVTSASLYLVWVELRIADDGTAKPGLTAPPGPVRGHGIDGMRERAALHGGRVTTGLAPEGGWLVTAALRPDAEAA
jgi:hypothetical protein